MSSDYAQLAADIIDGLPPGTSAADARRALNNIRAEDHTAALATMSGGGGGGAGAVLTATVTLDALEIQQLPTTPVEVVAGVADTMLNFLGAVAVLDNTAAPYANVDGGGYLFFANEETANASGNGDWAWLLTDGSDAGVIIIPSRLSINELGQQPLGPSNYYSDYVGKSLMIRAYNSGLGDFGGGDPLNSLTVTVYYTEVPLPAPVVP